MNKTEFSIEERAFMEEVPSLVNKYGANDVCLRYNVIFNERLSVEEFRDRFVAYKAWVKNRINHVNEFMDCVYEIFNAPIDIVISEFNKINSGETEDEPVSTPAPKSYTRILL